MKEYVINNKKYRLNLFDKLDSSSAYLIGYLCGDGSFAKKTHKRKSRMRVSSVNKETIIWIKENFCPDSAINSHIPINKKRNIKTKNMSHVLTMSSKFSEALNKYGVLSLKKDRRIVNISKNLFRCYLKGLIDSDGHFASGRRKDRNRVWAQLGITHQSTHVLSYVQKFLHEELNLSSFVNIRNDEDCLDLKMSKIDSVLKLINWLNEDDSCPFYKKYQTDKIVSLCNEKYV